MIARSFLIALVVGRILAMPTETPVPVEPTDIPTATPGEHIHPSPSLPPVSEATQGASVKYLEPRYFTEFNSQRVVIYYGPFLAPAVSVDMGMGNFPVVDGLKPPCASELGCLITYFHARLEYPDGGVANADTAMWLHHTAILSTGLKAGDSTCPEMSWLNEETGKETKMGRILASGNERTPVDLTGGGVTKAGLLYKDEDVWVFFTELMNEHDEEREAVLVIEYETVPYTEEVASEFKVAMPVWLDIAGLCTDSEVPVPDDYDKYGAIVWEQAVPWTADISGEVLLIVNHVHDGGLTLDVIKNGNIVCEGVVAYGERQEFIGHEHEHETDRGYDTDMKMSPKTKRQDEPLEGQVWHISSITTCRDVGRIEIGDELFVRTLYNFHEWPGMMGHDGPGSMEPVMGISILYVAQD